jgi:hypothetical protein
MLEQSASSNEFLYRGIDSVATELGMTAVQSMVEQAKAHESETGQTLEYAQIIPILDEMEGARAGSSFQAEQRAMELQKEQMQTAVVGEPSRLHKAGKNFLKYGFGGGFKSS